MDATAHYTDRSIWMEIKDEWIKVYYKYRSSTDCKDVSHALADSSKFLFLTRFLFHATYLQRVRLLSSKLDDHVFTRRS